MQQVTGHGVERAERLVHEQQVAALRERPGEGDALAHAAGELVRAPVAELAEVHEVEQLAATRCRALGLGHAVELQCELDVALGR